MTRHPLFTPDWPRYAIATHIAFWAASALLLAAFAAGFAGLVAGQPVIWLLYVWLVMGCLMGVSALASGKIYIANQVFAKKPTTGWAARAVGFVVMGCTGLLILFLHGLMSIRGG